MILVDTVEQHKRKGGVSIQEANNAIDTLLAFNKNEFTDEQVSMGMGHGFVLIADSKGLMAAHEDGMQASIDKAIEHGMANLPPELKGKIGPENIEAIALAVSFSCTAELAMLAQKTVNGKIEEASRLGLEEMPPGMSKFVDMIAEAVKAKLKSE